MQRRNGFFSGRNGSDALSLASSFAACLLLILSMFIDGLAGNLMWVLALICLLISYFRIFSKNVVRRQRENQKFLSLISPITKRWQQFKCRRQQKNLFCFFKCPQCGMVLRVPKGKGHIRITCKGCGHIFERNS